MPSLASLVRLVLPRRCVACRRPGDWMCDACGPRMRAARGAAVRALRRSDRHRRDVLPRVRTPALVHDGALGALARRAPARPHRRAGSAARSRPGAWRRRSSCTSCRGPQVDAIAAVPAVRDRLLAARRRSACGAGRRARALVGAAGRAARPAHARRPAAARARRGGAPAATSAAPSRPRAGPRSLALVDDVYTTGATVDECARALRRAGAGEVHVITLARTPLDRSFARAPPRGRLQRTTYPSGEARDAASGQREEPGCHRAHPRVRGSQARADRAPPDRGHARRSRARDRAQPARSAPTSTPS